MQGLFWKTPKKPFLIPLFPYFTGPPAGKTTVRSILKRSGAWTACGMPTGIPLENVVAALEKAGFTVES